MEPQTESRRRRRPAQPVIIEEPEQEEIFQPTHIHAMPVKVFNEATNSVESVKVERIPREPRKIKKVKPKRIKAKRSFCQFLSAAILIAYTIYIVQYFFGASADFSGETATVNLAGSIATLMVTPHMLFCTLASIFSAIAFLANSGGFALTAAILECVAAILFIMYAPFLIPSIVLGFIGYARIGALKRKAERLKEEYL